MVNYQTYPIKNVVYFRSRYLFFNVKVIKYKTLSTHLVIIYIFNKFDHITLKLVIIIFRVVNFKDSFLNY